MKHLLSFFMLSTPICFLTLIWGVSSCSQIDAEKAKVRPPQSYQCNFHDKPLIVIGWAGNTSIRRYTMKDLERGTVIRGVRHYDLKCYALDIVLSESEKKKIEILTKKENSQIKVNLIYLI